MSICNKIPKSGFEIPKKKSHFSTLQFYKSFFARKFKRFKNLKSIFLTKKNQILKSEDNNFGAKIQIFAQTAYMLILALKFKLFLVYNHCIIIFHVSLHLLKFMKIIIIIRFEKKVKKGSSKWGIIATSHSWWQWRNKSKNLTLLIWKHSTFKTQCLKTKKYPIWIFALKISILLIRRFLNFGAKNSGNCSG